jgi:broad specificity phosphatase PhoE
LIFSNFSDKYVVAKIMVEAKPNRHVVYLVRHGETHENAAHIQSGQRTPATLNRKGVSDAQNVADWLKDNNPNITVIWSSPLHRARTTAEYIAKSTGALVYEKDELKEVDLGGVDGLTIEQAKVLYPEYYQRRKTDSSFRFHAPWPGGGESYADVLDRVRPIANELEVIEHDIVVIGHRAINRLLMAELTGATVEEVERFSQKNNEVVEIKLPERTVRSHIT